MKLQFIILKKPEFQAEKLFLAGNFQVGGWGKWREDTDWHCKDAGNCWIATIQIEKPGNYEFKFITYSSQVQNTYQVEWLPKEKNLTIRVPNDAQPYEVLTCFIVPMDDSSQPNNTFLLNTLNSWLGYKTAHEREEWKFREQEGYLILLKTLPFWTLPYEFKIATLSEKRHWENWFPDNNIIVAKDFFLPLRSGNKSYFHGGDEVILQLFDWNTATNHRNRWYPELQNYVRQIKAAGFTAVWMPPCWYDTSDNKVGYFWQDFSKNSAYGSEQNLKMIAAVFKANGIKVIYDFVINHRNLDVAVHDDVWAKIPLAEQRANLVHKETHKFERFDNGRNDLNLNSEAVFDAFVNEMINLIQNYSAGGFRFDLAKGFDANIPRKMLVAAEEKMQLANLSYPELFVVGEYWDEENQDRVKTLWSDQSHSTVFDFILQKQFRVRVPQNIDDFHNTGLRKALSANVIQSWREVAITFVDNHDTGYSDYNHNIHYFHYAAKLAKDKFVDRDFRKAAYAYILLAPGTPCVYWPHWKFWGEKDGTHQLINDCIKIRKGLGITSAAAIDFHSRVDREGVAFKTKGLFGEINVVLNIKQKLRPAEVLNSNLAVFHDNQNQIFLGVSRDSEIHALMNTLTTFQETHAGHRLTMNAH